MYIYNENSKSFIEDPRYRGGRSRGVVPTITETATRKMQDRGARPATTIQVTLSKDQIEQLRGAKPIQYQLLVSLIREIEKLRSNTPSGSSTPDSEETTVRMSRTQINNIRNAEPNTIADLVEATRPTPPPNPAPIPRPVPIPRVTRQALVRAQQEALDQPISTRLRPR